MSKKVTANFLDRYGFVEDDEGAFEIHLKGFLFLSIDVSGEKPVSFLFRTAPLSGHITKPLIGVELQTKKDVKKLYKILTSKKLEKNGN